MLKIVIFLHLIIVSLLGNLIGIIQIKLGLLSDVNNGILIQYGTVTSTVQTLPVSYKDTTYRIYLGYITGTDGCWYTKNKTISSFNHYIKRYGINETASATNNYFLTLGFLIMV